MNPSFVHPVVHCAGVDADVVVMSAPVFIFIVCFFVFLILFITNGETVIALLGLIQESESEICKIRSFSLFYFNYI